MSRTERLSVRNGQCTDLDAIPVLPFQEFRDGILADVAEGGRLALLTAWPREADAGHRLLAVIARDGKGLLDTSSTLVDASYPSLTPECPQAHLFEREIHESWGLVAEGHPWDKPVRHPVRRLDGAPCTPTSPGDIEAWRLEGDDVHEVAVGPVHAGVIEPGHFRFQCHGEDVFHLEIALGYQHRGVEQALRDGPHPSTAAIVETLAGDTSVAHATAWAQAMEALSGVVPPPRAHAIRALGLELERLANHTGDLGALAGDVGFLPTASFCGRLRGDWLNITAMLCGNRFGRGLVRPGGVRHDVDALLARKMTDRITETFRDVSGAARLLFDTPSVLGRFEETGTVSAADARLLGMVGPAARASGIAVDVRRDFPLGAWAERKLKPAVDDSGDVLARARIRLREIEESTRCCLDWLAALGDAGGPTQAEHPEAPVASAASPHAIVVSLVEGWRGEVLHMLVTDGNRRTRIHKIVDPSFHNWPGLALALRGQRISDFPLCNKSFNLSYCGFDL
jgi:Ni,Fe-hydrogenase III large subunit